MSKHKITFLPDNLQIEIPTGATIMEAAVKAGLEIEGPCGGKGTCGKCRVKLVGDKRSKTEVLACRTQVTQDLMVELPQQDVYLNRKSNLTQGEVNVQVVPGIQKVAVQVKGPSLSNQVADASRLMEELNDNSLNIKLEALRSLPGALRSHKHLVTAVIRGNQALVVEPGDTRDVFYGLAVDIGTTTVVATVVNLLTGENVATASASNSQNIFGADVISRIEHAMTNPKGLDQLRKRVVQVINRLIGKMSETTGILPEQIYQAAVVGNTTMSHLFLGLDPSYLAPSPFIPASTHLIELEAKEVGLLIASPAPVYVLPNIAGYVGADTVGVILATEVYQSTGIKLAVDIGTNGELVLATPEQLITCSTAAGPAFEGAQIQYGMRAAAGAIEGVTINDDVELKVIGDVPAKGICGSGLMDVVSELVRVSIIEPGGRMLSQGEAQHLPVNLQQRLGKEGETAYFILAAEQETGAGPVLLTQKDVREVQLAKAAMRAGIQIMLEQAGLTYTDIDQVLLAGAFGSYINKKSAVGIGLLPPVSQEKIRSVGNAAGAGAKLALVSVEMREKAKEIAQQVKHLELSTRQDFQEQFIEALSF